MFPYPLKSLGQDWTTPLEDLQRYCWNRHISSCLRWPGHYSRAPYPYLSSRHFSLNCRPPLLFESGTQFQYYNWRPDHLSNTSLMHLSSYIMNSDKDEPSSKRRKRHGKRDVYLGKRTGVRITVLDILESHSVLGMVSLFSTVSLSTNVEKDYKTI